ncbi:MAG: hypothetical protein J6X85_06690 [Ruminococcus sp.]|nr:hypothetical protein [Ruminococcus sp.]
MEQDRKRAPLMSKADVIILAVYAFAFMFLGGVTFLWFVDDLSFTPAFLGWFLYLIGVCVLYRRSRENVTLKRILIFIRAAAVILMIGAYTMPVICTNYSKSSFMYPLKRYIFINGVNETAGDLLPEKLPEGVTVYYFRTEPRIMFAQDYTPYAYLVLHTSDKSYLKSYEAMISDNSSYTRSVCDLEAERKERGKDKYSGEDTYLNGRPEKLPLHVYDRMYQDAYIRDDLDGSVIFCGWNSYTGALINYNTGLLVIWR